MLKQSYIYFAIAGEDKILGGTLDSETGAIEIRHEIAVPWGPEAIAVDPGKRFLFVGCHPRNASKHGSCESKMYSYWIDWQTGGLTLINSVALQDAPTFVAVDRTSRFLLSAYYRAGKAAVHRIGADGAIGEATQWFESGGGAHCIQVDTSNRFAFLPHIATSKVNINYWPPNGNSNHILPGASNTILQFKFDDATGTLIPNAPFKLPGERGGGPRHYCFHPRLNVVYFANEQGCAVTAYALNPTEGTLTPLQHISTLPPEGYDNYASCSSLRVTHSGKFLYVLNRGLDSVACFSVDPTTGRLKSNGLVPTEAQPHALELDLDDRFLFVAGHTSGCLTTYRVQEDGKLQPIASRAIGKQPKWILVTRQET